ncbi:hypothetical protein ACJMK2_023244 [Sinanodonta woodiana]|uniref:C-type lectin domain-containing protein n=1 Tax=Sinanodonta woodiana TaxID=1069815 RepID=A0ABD3T4D2_SINWO
MGHLTRWYATVILVCGTVAALDDPYIHITKRLNNIERNVNANLEIFRSEMTVMFEIMNRINSSVFDLKEMFLNNRKHDPNDEPTKPVSVNASTGSSMSSHLPSFELSLQAHLKSIRNGFGAEKRARIKLTNDVDRILLALKENNFSVHTKQRNVDRNLTDVVRTLAELKEENRISLTKMQEKLEAKQTSVEDNVRQLTDAKLRIVERNLTDVVRTLAELKEENMKSLTKMQDKLEAKQTSVEDTVRQLIEDAATKKRTCPALFEKHGNSCYFSVPIAETWLNAKLICHLLDADLLKMDNQNEENVVAGVIKRSKANSYPYLWIDGTDLMIEGTFQWLRTNGQPEKLGYNGWSKGEPNGNTIENCLMIYNNKGNLMKWNDYGCDNRIPFVCEKEL